MEELGVDGGAQDLVAVAVDPGRRPAAHVPDLGHVLRRRQVVADAADRSSSRCQGLNVGAVTSVVGLMYGARPRGSGVDMEGSPPSAAVRRDGAGQGLRRRCFDPCRLGALDAPDRSPSQIECRPQISIAALVSTGRPATPARAARAPFRAPACGHSPAARLTDSYAALRRPMRTSLLPVSGRSRSRHIFLSVCGCSRPRSIYRLAGRLLPAAGLIAPGRPWRCRTPRRISPRPGCRGRSRTRRCP